jgi:hypothetical protein
MKKTVSILLSAVLVFSALVFATGCESAQEVDLSKYVTYEGFSGFATLNTTPSISDYEDQYDKLKEKKDKAKDDDDDSAYEDYKEQISQLRDLSRALEKVEFKLEKGDDGKLANGDKIKIKAKYNEDKIEKYNVKFTADEFEVTVKGLEEKEVIDAFADDACVLEYSGLDGDGSVYASSYKKDDCTVYYSISPDSDLSNGDEITVTASIYDDDYALKDSEDGVTATKTYKVEGLGTIPENLNDVDTTDVDKIYLDKITEKATIEKGLTDEGYDFGIAGDDYRYAKLKIVSCGDIKAEKKFYGYKATTDGKDSIYAIVYSQTAKVSIVSPSYSSKLKKGATKDVTAYYVAYMTNNTMVVDDTFKLKSEDYYYISTNDCFESVNDAVKSVKEYYDDYEYSAVK